MMLVLMMSRLNEKEKQLTMVQQQLFDKDRQLTAMMQQEMLSEHKQQGTRVTCTCIVRSI